MDSSIRTPWFYPAQGVILGAMLVTVFLAPPIWISLAALLGLVSTNALGRLRNVVRGRPPKTWNKEPALVVILQLASAAIVAALMWYFVSVQGLTWAAWVGGLAAVAAVSAIGLLADRRSAEPDAVTL